MILYTHIDLYMYIFIVTHRTYVQFQPTSTLLVPPKGCNHWAFNVEEILVFKAKGFWGWNTLAPADWRIRSSFPENPCFPLDLMGGFTKEWLIKKAEPHIFLRLQVNRGTVPEFEVKKGQGEMYNHIPFAAKNVFQALLSEACCTLKPTRKRKNSV